MFFISLLAAIVAVTVPTPGPAAGQREIPTIVTVISSPYCNSLADHFNGALMPMLANDRTLEGVGQQLEDLDTLFSGLDYVERYVRVRDTIGREETVINESLSGISQQIIALRQGAALTTDTQATAQIHDAAQDLQNAYDHQRQLGIDLQALHQAMMDYNVSHAHPVPGGFDPQEMAEPSDMKNIQSYLRFDSQRAVIAQNEDHAVDIAYAAAQNYCVPKK